MRQNIGTLSTGDRGHGSRFSRHLALGLFAAALLSSGACLRNVDQKANSGKDYRNKGAKKIELEDGEGSAKGIVTYPGGDRVDWKQIEIPADKKGTLRIKLKHRPPRRGLDVAFNVFDQYGRRVGRGKPSLKRAKRTKRAKIANVEAGVYYIQVYAPRRIDAGSYKLSIQFKEQKILDPVDIEALADKIPDPPTLPAPIEPVVLTPEQIAAKEAADAAAKEAADKAAADKAAADAAAPKPMTAKVIGFQMASGGEVIITLNRGKKAGVKRGWSGQVLQGGRGGSPLSGGDFKVMKVTGRKSIGKVKLSLDAIRANKYVLLSPQ